MTRPGETGAVKKAWGSAIPVALVYPNSYRLGMGNLGFQFLYHSFNSHSRFLAERFFIPDVSSQRESTSSRLLSEESRRPLSDFALIAFSIPFENDLIRVAAALISSGIPPLHKDRQAKDPIVIAGGISVSMNPEPLAPFLDLVFIGELGDDAQSAEFFTVLGEVLLVSSRTRVSRIDLLEAFQNVPGVYVPSAYTFSFREDGIISEIRPKPGFPSRIQAVKRLDEQGPVPVSVLFSGEAEFGDSLLVEVNRGCGRGCRFCAAGWIHFPVRYASLTRLRETVEPACSQGKTVGIVGSDLAGHPDLEKILAHIIDSGGRFSLSSIRPEGLTPEIIRLIAKTGQKTATLAPEVASTRMKRVIGKKISSDRFHEIIEKLIAAGIRNIRFYFMIGLPTETDDDVQSIVDFITDCRKVFLNASRSRKNIGKISVQLNPFVPKPWTPFQWASMDPFKTIDHRLKMVLNGLRNMPNVNVRAESVRESLLQGLLSRGDRTICATVLGIALQGGQWGAVLKKLSHKLAFYVHRERSIDEIFPWEVTDHGISRKTLRSVYEKALSV
ncbi:MAG: radical SAM protein [Desulfomonile sp.]